MAAWIRDNSNSGDLNPAWGNVCHPPEGSRPLGEMLYDRLDFVIVVIRASWIGLGLASVVSSGLTHIRIARILQIVTPRVLPVLACED